MKHLHLPEKYLALVQGLIKKHLPDAEVWAYGSRVTGQSHEASDLDLVVLNADDCIKVETFREALRSSNIPILIDVMDWQRIPQSFKDEINRKHIVI